MDVDFVDYSRFYRLWTDQELVLPGTVLEVKNQFLLGQTNDKDCLRDRPNPGGLGLQCS